MSDTDPKTEKLELRDNLDALTAAIGLARANECELPVGSRFGSFRLMGLLGSGGMGTVYLAEQVAPVHRKVALKLLPAARHDDSALLRLGMESQALAQMQHPCIAQFFDAGMSPQGHPWLAMEHVDGQPMNRYLAAHEVSLEERIELFMALCRGVAHAHQRGIIHCDLKPSNVLLTKVDGKTVPKIIDFGIARVADISGAGSSEGTPRYMSPEQADAWPSAVDTRTDVHALGLILHELLCDRPQRDSALFDTASFENLPSLILESPVRLPSSQVGDPHRARLLRGELDAIVARATALDPEQRYAAAADLLEDLRRYRDSRPVLAMPASRGYALRCFLRRNATASASAALFAVVVSVLLWRLFDQLEQTRIERDSAREVAAVLVTTFEAADPALYPGGSMSVRELLSRSARRVADQAMADDVRLRVLQSLGTVQHRLELYEDALYTLGHARELATRRSHEERFDVELMFARAQMDSEAFDVAATLIEQLLQRGSHAAHTLRAKVLVLAAENFTYLNRYDEARQALNDAWSLPLMAGDEELRIRWYQLSGNLHRYVGETEAAFADMERALSLAESVWGENGLLTLVVLNDLAIAQSRAGRLEQAESNFRRIIAAADLIWGEPSADTARTMSNLASLLERSERGDEAEVLYRQAVAIFRERTGERSMDTAIALNGLAMTRENAGQPEVALAAYRESADILQEILGDRHHILGIALHNQARCLLLLGDSDSAAVLLQESGEILRESLGESHQRYFVWATTQAQWLARGNRDEEALALLALAEPGLEAAHGAQSREALRARELKAALLAKLGRCEELQALYEDYPQTLLPRQVCLQH